ncbi:MAG TPA: ATP-grasp fold amidoligase family protein [Synergistales bacterium]|nr:ATP-grasp fold amidoligase family protein [Synergistales bacterium]
MINFLDGFYLLCEKARFYKKLGYFCDLKDPRSFNEKLFWRKVYDRNPLFPVVSDKIRVRDFIRQQIGKEKAEEFLIPLLHVTDEPGDIPFDNLPEEFVIKANHGSGWLMISDNMSRLSRKDIIKTSRAWLKRSFRRNQLEWAYSAIKPMILVEKLLKDQGQIPMDFKFFVFHGEVKMINVHHGRFSDHRMSYYDPQMHRIRHHSRWKKEGPPVSKPENFNEMVWLAETLGSAFDFVRVDMYNITGKIFIGELTIYPSSGTHPYDREFDYELGSYWTLPHH